MTPTAWATTGDPEEGSCDDLQVRGISEIALGPAGGRLDPVRRMYVSTRGGSWWDGEVW